MSAKQYRQIRAVIAVFISLLVSVSVSIDSYLLAAAAVITGMVFMILVRSKARITIDEREAAVREKAARWAYAIFTPTLGLGAFLMLIPTHSGLGVFAKGQWEFIESLGMIFAYLTLYLIGVYSVAFYFINKKYGGDEE